MNTIIEREIIKSFFLKNKQDRLIWELNNPRKRKRFVDRIAHPTYIDESCMKVSEMNSLEEVKHFLQNISGTNEIYMIGESYIGEITIDNAINYLRRNEICILYCGNGIGYYQPEENYGDFKKYILKKRVCDIFSVNEIS